MLRCGYINTSNLVDSQLTMDRGTPQGSILSPLMANIYFHQLDEYITNEIIPEFDKGANNKKQNPDYVRMTSNWSEGV